MKIDERIHMSRKELAEALQRRLQPIETTFQKHIPQYNNEWDQLITAVAWLLRNNVFWYNPNKYEGGALVMSYDFVPYENNNLYKVNDFVEKLHPIGFKNESPPSIQEKKIISELQDYFKKVLDNVASILNIRFEPRELRKPSPNTQKPQLRLLFYRNKGEKKEDMHIGFGGFPNNFDSRGDIWINLVNPSTKKPWGRDLREIKSTIIHEIGHVLGLSHFFLHDKENAVCSVRDYKISSSPPVFYYKKSKTRFRGTPVRNKYSNISDTIMAYEQHYNIYRPGFKENDHFGYVDYMALLSAYGPNPNNEDVNHITYSYKEDKLLLKDINLDNYNRIKQSIPERSIQYKQIKPKRANQVPAFRLSDNPKYKKGSLASKELTVQLDGSSFFDQAESRQAKLKAEGGVSFFSTMPIHIDGFAGHTQIRGFRLSDDIGRLSFELVFSPKTPVSKLVGSPDKDFIFFNKNIEYVSGGAGFDLYCFYQDKWKKHVIEERQDEVQNYIVLYQPSLNHLALYRSRDDLFIFDSRQPRKKSIKFKGYFLSKALNYSALRNSYAVLVIHKKKIEHADNIKCFRNQFVSIMKLKTEALKPGERIPFMKGLLTSAHLKSEKFQQRLAKRLVRYGSDYSISINANKYNIRRSHRNRYGTTIRLNGVPDYIQSRTLGYRRRGNDLLIAWQRKGKEKTYGFVVLDFFAKDAPPIHLVDTYQRHLLTFNGMNGYGPIEGVNPHVVGSKWHQVRFP